MPGQFGNAALAGHRTTYGAPFFDIDALAPGDEIKVTTLTGTYVYRVSGQQVVSPSDYEVIATTDLDAALLTLVSCHPRYTARQRIIVSAELDPAKSSTPLPPTVNYGQPAELAGSDEPNDPANTVAPDGDGLGGALNEEDATPSTAADSGDASNVGSAPVGNEGPDRPAPPSAGEGSGISLAEDSASVELLQQGWFSDPNAWPHVAAWGAVVSAIALFAWALSLQTRRNWIGLLAGFGPFVIALYFFFQNVNRLLPPNI
jgi:sortase A